MVVRAFLMTAVGAVLAASSHAIVFSTVSTSGTTDGAWSLVGPNGINFSLADGNSINGAVRGAIDLKFKVTADAGFVLSDFTASPVGFVRNRGAADLLTTLVGTPGAGPFHTVTTAPAGIKLSLVDVTYSPLGAPVYTVDAHIQLSSVHATSGGPSIASLSQLAFRFNEQAVPEPASMAVIGIGLAGVLSRSRKRKV